MTLRYQYSRAERLIVTYLCIYMMRKERLGVLYWAPTIFYHSGNSLQGDELTYYYYLLIEASAVGAYKRELEPNTYLNKVEDKQGADRFIYYILLYRTAKKKK